LYVSIDAGEKWVRLKNNIPPVPVHDLLVHPRENDLVVGTYGRGLYVTDITPLQEMNERVLDKDVHFFAIEPKPQRIRAGWGWYRLYGDRVLSTPNEPNAIRLNYYLKEKVNGKATITISDPSGTEVSTLMGTTDSGMNSVLWNMNRMSGQGKGTTYRYTDEIIYGRDETDKLVPPGEYTVVLEVKGKRLTERAKITKRVGWPVGPAGSSYEQ
jgi:hypothetical protein